MRDGFNFNLKEDARVKFVYTSPELNQNIEISLDGDEATMDNLVDAFQRFLGALGLPLPEGVHLGFFELNEEGEENEEEGEE